MNEQLPSPNPHRGWHERGYLPHFDSPDAIQMITHRLGDALPTEVIDRLANEPFTDEGDAAYRARIETWLDAGHGACLLRAQQAARCVADAWRHFDGIRYFLHAWVIMPNHVHVLVQVTRAALPEVVKGWKSYTARQINRLTSRSGPVWQQDYWDRFVRNEAHYLSCLAYIQQNPIKAGLAATPEAWLWTWVRPEEEERCG